MTEDNGNGYKQKRAFFEGKVLSQLENLSSNMEKGFKEIHSKIDKQENKDAAHDKSIGVLETDVATIKTEVANIKTKSGVIGGSIAACLMAIVEFIKRFT